MLLLSFACTNPTMKKDTQQGNFSTLTYNIHGLPSAVTQDDTEARILQIAPLLNAFPIIGLQEDWMLDHHIALTDITQHPTQLYFDEKLDDDKVYGSGLTFLSSFSLNKHEHIHYTTCFGYLENSSDCFASKGLQFAEIALDTDVYLHVYNTHLEAGGGEEDHVVREAQINTIIETVERLSSQTPFVLLGDFNLRYSDEIDVPLLENLITSLDLKHACFETQCPEEDHIDQIFFRGGSEIEIDVTDWHRHENFVDTQGIDLSDHPAISADFTWSSIPLE